MNKRRNFSRSFFVLAFVILLAGCSCPLCSKSEKSCCGGENVTCLKESSKAIAVGNLVVVTSVEQLEDLKASTKNLIVKFFAPWCPPCRAMEPVDRDIAKKFADKATIAKVDIDKFPQAAGTFSVQGVPTYVFLKDGKEVDRFVGAKGAGEYEKMIKEKFGL